MRTPAGPARRNEVESVEMKTPVPTTEQMDIAMMCLSETCAGKPDVLSNRRSLRLGIEAMTRVGAVEGAAIELG